ncbi:E3 ubiquitin-protein ligase TRIM47-like [Haliotis rubra]|uniref:E3 ubiquitin-protein ligase TRIM47-like n=1 Tax=Haliotis rubra TaxID=36100 RepID=UPI001EE52F18|nr:E3 ubiquitin-protein ligase TRIM47-like [Haliotis rubra]
MDDDMRIQLSCSVCLDLYTDPLLLPCLHSLCRQCVHNLVACGIPECPECKNAIPPDPNTLPKNFPLSSLVAIYKQSMTTSSRPTAESVLTRVTGAQEQTTRLTVASSSQRSWSSYEPIFNRQCSACDAGENTPSEVACLTCSIAFCVPCLEECHPNDNGHALVSLEEAEMTTICAICNFSSVTTCIECQMSFCMPCLGNYHPTIRSAPGHTLLPTPTRRRHSSSEPSVPQRSFSESHWGREAQVYYGNSSIPERGQSTLSVATVRDDRHVQEQLIEVMNRQQRVILELMDVFGRERHET